MTIRFLRQWNGYDDQDVASLTSSEELRLVTAGIATYDIAAKKSGPTLEDIVSKTSASGVKSNILIPFGDSLVARYWKSLSITGTITVSNGIATATTASNHLAPIGSRVRVGLSTAAGLNGVFTITDTPAANQFSFAVNGPTPDSVAVVSEIAYFESDQNFSTEFMHYMRIFTKQRFSVPYNGGLGGDDTGEALSRLAKESIVGMNPGRVLIQIGTNDFLNATSQDASAAIANLTAIYQHFLSAGIAVDACTVPPVGAGHADVSNVTKIGYLMNLNKWIRDYVRATPGMSLHDVYQWVSDPAQSNGQARSGYLVDTVHYDKTGAYVVGQNMAANYASWLGAHPDKLPASQADGWTFNTSSKNRFQNHFFQGAGPVATGWTTAYTGGTKTDSTVARTVNKDGDTLGQNQKILLNGTNGTILCYQDPTSRLTAGKTYIARGCATISKDTLTNFFVELSMGFTVDGIARTIRAGLQNVVDSTGFFHLETPPFVFPAGASSPVFYLRAVATGTTTAAFIEWGRVELEQVD